MINYTDQRLDKALFRLALWITGFSLFLGATIGWIIMSIAIK